MSNTKAAGPPNLFEVFVCLKLEEHGWPAGRLSCVAVPLDARWVHAEPVPPDAFRSLGLWPARSKDEAKKAALAFMGKAVTP